MENIPVSSCAAQESSFFKEKSNDALVFLMGNLEEADKDILKDLFEKIRIKEKYGKLAKRGRF